ncbi:MAG: hypothetical protein K6F47_09725 [Bacteroidaceae bacterium]|nr:hypothetical protein [Bacteroidaceae bacterium]
MSKKLLHMWLMAIMMVFSMSVYALEKVGNVYQIGTADDLKAFAELVNGGEAYANAVLTADIDKGMDGTMIGSSSYDYQGTFDGKGHTITINLFGNETQATAIFRNTGIHAIVQNLKVQGTITTNQKLAAGIAAWNSGVIRGCYVDVTVESSVAGDATHGGIAAVGYRGTVIENCLSKFVVKGAATQNCGGIVGWCSDALNIVNCLVISDGSSFDLSNNGSGNIGRNDGNVRVPDLEKYNADSYANRPAGACYNNYVTNKWGDNKATSVVSYDKLADGKICYQLNNDQSRIAWVQRIGTDPFPVPAAFGSGQVYASSPTGCNGKGEGELTFSNTGTVQATAHQFDKYGMCPVCGCFNFHAFEFDDAERFDPVDRAVCLSSADDISLAEGWNRVGDGFKLNMKMVNDIEIHTEGQLIFNDANWVNSNFNGDGHTLTIEMADIAVENASFIPKMTGVFENVIMHGSISTSKKYAGSVTSHTYDDKVIIRNVYSDIDINASADGDNTSAGIVGVSESKTRLENVIYAGKISGVENGNTESLAGFCGWSAGQTYFSNCALIGSIDNALGDSKTISRNPGNITCQNVYCIEDYDFGDNDKFTLIDDPASIENGALAYALNGNQGGVDRFYQKIGEDLAPMPIKKEGALVYANAPDYRCDGQPLGKTTYSNSPSGDPVLPDHQYADGFCTVCNGLQEDFLTPVDGWFEISNGAELVWWTNYAAKHLDASARLTDDIDMDGYCERWANVGTEGAPFYGNFDGQFHTISNLNVDKPEDNGVGLIAVMNSLPSKGFGGISDDDARAAEGVYIKNVTLDESCSLLGRGYVALVGMTAPWAGHVNIKGVMMCGDVTANGGPNAAGVFGCVMGSACHVTIDNCGMVGNVYGPKENGSFSGWLGDWAEVTNCFAVGEVEGIQSEDRYFARYGDSRVNDNIKNCYALHGTQEHVGIVTAEDFESGALAWKANGEQFRTSYWYQTIGVDMYPFADPSHGTVIYAAEKYFSVANEEELADVAAEIQAYEENAVAETVATSSLLTEYRELMEALTEAASVQEFADALDAVYGKKGTLAENAAVYEAYIAKCEETKAFLEANDNFTGLLREELEYYLAENDEPNDDNPLGTYEYIKETHLATAEEIAAETKRVEEWLQAAISNDIVPGSDISKLIPNYDFSKQKENWTDAWCTGFGEAKDEKGKTYVGVEAWNASGDMYQTLENMKPGYYLVGINGAFRPCNDRYNTNYAAGIYANGVFNYFPAIREDYVAVKDTMDQQNCNLHGAGAHDLAIYSDFSSTNSDNGAEIIGYAVHGETGMAIAAMVDRYKAYTIGYVGEDGKLTIGIKNPGTKYSNDWTGWGALKVIYCGEEGDEVDEALDNVLDNMMARAGSIMVYEPNGCFDKDNPAAAAPNFPAELKGELEAVVAQAQAAEDADAKAAAATAFSDIFQRIYEGKQAYIKLHNTAASFESIEFGNLPLIEKDPELDEWIETEEYVFTQEEISDLYENIAAPLYEAYEEGTYSIEQALNPEVLNNNLVKEIMPAQDEDGYYLIGTVKQLVAFRAMSTNVDYTVKAKLTADIDLKGVGMQPINLSNYSYRGTFDGQGHAITNAYILHNAERTGLFNTLDGATIKNLKLTGEYFSDNKFIGGIAGYTYNSRIENCDVAVTINSLIPADGNGGAQDGTHGGLIGVNEGAGTVVENCLVNCAILGENTNSCGGVCGWATNSLTVNNTLILSSKYTASANGSNTVSRNPDKCTVNNVFYVTQFGDAKGTKVTEEQLASGEICWRLNGEKGEGSHWFQTLGKEATPHLYSGDYVWKYGDDYQNVRPNLQLNAFASNLSASTNAEEVVICYTLNAEAKSGAINFYVGDELKYSHVLKSGDLFAGGHEVGVDNSLLGVPAGTKMTYTLDVTGIGTKQVAKIGESYKVYGPYGMAINNNPASKGFGQILLVESWVKDYGQGYISSDKPGALYAFDAAFRPINSVDGTPGFYGGLDIANEKPLVISGSSTFDLKDIRFTEDGRLFVARAAGLSNSSVYEINPDDLNEPWKPVFTGGTLDETTGITYVGDVEQNRMAISLAFEGKGADLKMYVLGGQRSNGEYNTTDYNCSVYNLGTATEWSGAPSASFEPLNGVYTYAPSYVGIQTDGQGGLWYIQNRTTEETPALKHFNASEWAEDFSNNSVNPNGARIAVTTDGKYLAIPQGSGKIVLYETNYVPMANGKIDLTPVTVINVAESSITSLAFDYANNLYVASGGTETVSRYAIPSWTDNKSVTPAIEGFTVGVDGGDPVGIGNVDANDKANNGTIYNIAGQRVSKTQKGVYIVDGKKVSVK